MGTLSGEATLFLFIFVYPFIRVKSQGTNKCFPTRKFFLLRVDPILKELHCPGKQTGSHKKLPPFENMAETDEGVLRHLTNLLS